MRFKDPTINKWLWKWHIISGLVCIPFLLLLSVTGILYLFKEDYNDQRYQAARFVEAPASTQAEALSLRLPLAQQLAAAAGHIKKPIAEVQIPQALDQATAFRVAAKGRTRHLVYVNPYTAEVTGEFVQQDSLMYKIRKLHGELLLGKTGTLVVELVASWFIVLILTGLYIWWPAKKFRLASYFSIRTSQGKSVLLRDLHAVVGFWISVFMLVILAGGMPWTDVFGNNLKWVQAKTNSGFPQDWGRTDLESQTNGQSSLSIDSIANIAQNHKLQGQITISMPRSELAVYSIKNESLLLRNQEVLHIDQYSGKVVKALTWNEVGLLMNLRQVAMRLHQGEYGFINWLIVLLVVLTFTVSTTAGFARYWLRRPKGSWGLPKVPDSFQPGVGLLVPITGCALLFPMFGISLLMLFLFSLVAKFFKTQRLSATT